MEVTMQLLGPGVVLHHERSQRVKKSPLQKDKIQCAFVQYLEDGSKIKCIMGAVSEGLAHGFLCKEHYYNDRYPKKEKEETEKDK